MRVTVSTTFSMAACVDGGTLPNSLSRWILTVCLRELKPFDDDGSFKVSKLRFSMERMGAQWDTCVHRRPGCVGVQPDRIDAVQPVLETDLFRRRKFYGIELKL